MENTEQSTNKIQYGGKLDADLFAVIDQMRINEDRPMSNMIQVLLKTHPRVQELLGTANAETAAGGN